MKRRTFMLAVAATAATAAGAGQVSARSSPELNGDSDLTPIPYAATDVEIEGVDPGGDPLGFVEDDGAESSLEEYGGTVEQTPTDADGNDQPHNPFTLRADYIDADEYSAFPRDRTDSNDDPISGLDASFWSTTSSEAAVADTTPASGGPGLEFSTSGLADGSTAGIEFTEVDITSGVSRKELQLVVSISSLGGTADVRVGDGSTWATATIDSAADPDAVGTIATSTGDGIVFQSDVGELSSSLDQISTIQIRAHDGDATIEVAALNVERESKWSFGDREEWETSDNENIVTAEYVEPVGSYSIADLSTLDDVFTGGAINPVTVGVEYYPTSTDYETTDPADPAYDSKLEVVDNIEIPSAYELSHGSIGVKLDLGMSPSQWITLESKAGLSDPIELGDREDTSFTDQSGPLDTASVDDTISIGSASSGEYFAVNQGLDVTADQLEEIEGGGGATTGYFSGGGGGGFLSTPMGIVSTIGTGLAAYVAIARGWVGRLLGGS
jgi:hypothetical protein